MIFFVSGGSRGIGADIALAAVRAGHDVALTYLQNRARAEEVVERARHIDPTRRCAAFQLDVRDSAAVDDVGERVLDAMGTVDVVVCNAGISRDGLAVSMSDQDWRDVIDTNLTGSFFVARQFLPAMLANGCGRIILISSIGQDGHVGQANYGASKAGLVGLAATLAKEYGRKGITCNVVAPGLVEGTDLTRDTVSKEGMDLWSRLCPTGRMARLDEVSNVVLFLASQGASYVNGQTIAVNGGGFDWIV